MKSHTPARRICSQVFLVLVALGSAACSARSDRLTDTGISAEEVASSAQTADIVANAILEDVRYENYPDTMDGTMVWRVTRCHAGTCVAGEQLKTRFSGPFSTSGEFCDLRNGCLKRKSLESYRGEIFLVTLTRAPYLHQVAARQGTPQEGYLSLNRGYYLISQGALYHNDKHRLIDARYEEVRSLLTGE
ncbi:hypothetical protein WCE34_07010 [Luteimonas sp. MJ204]|uniref:hypothetical protein n=1 Tax=Lysobacteraceae TaxID=32033 RepID=UPI001881C036|nr:hypothetical protein [Lysobacter sp. H23M47]QOW24818.1 hypothetical protein INQ43_01685 [Lysobacter sp. H23M47]